LALVALVAMLLLVPMAEILKLLQLHQMVEAMAVPGTQVLAWLLPLAALAEVCLTQPIWVALLERLEPLIKVLRVVIMLVTVEVKQVQEAAAQVVLVQILVPPKFLMEVLVALALQFP
jgi:hypothetical protein